MPKRKRQEVICDECGNEATIIHYSRDDATFCPFCGEQAYIPSPDEDDGEDDESEED